MTKNVLSVKNHHMFVLSVLIEILLLFMANVPVVETNILIKAMEFARNAMNLVLHVTDLTLIIVLLIVILIVLLITQIEKMYTMSFWLKQVVI